MDCVVLELDLPDMSGFEVLVELVPVARHPTVPVIVLTRLPNRMLTELAVKNGAQAGLHKPTTTGDQLREAVFNAIAAVPRDDKEDREVFKFSRSKTESPVAVSPLGRGPARG
ncbi:response regulator [Nitrospira sp. KM1]|uniref:response regulator n=1 Tax=Nitrospira sp. KM1 TaxID=1936990 RepID=UPI003519F120